MKREWVIRRIRFAIRQYPKRLKRLFTYYFHPFYTKPKFRAFPFMLAECFFLFDIYEILSNLLKPSARQLTDKEILRGGEIFGKSIDFDVIMMDEKAHLLTRHLNVAYVGFNTINSWGKMRDDILIHELVHVWQYQHFGAGYIINALVAQRSAAGYNYTQATAYLIPPESTKKWYEYDSIHQLNAEQQADLVQDYYRLKKGMTAEWEKKFTTHDLDKFGKFIQEIRTGS
jgi:hypothetical protein